MAAEMTLKPRILLITTGGTITMTSGPGGSLASPADRNCHLLEKIPELATLATIEVLPLLNTDSSNLQPGTWVELARAVYDRMREYDGFVITHGTDTLSYTAAAIAFFLQDLGKPVVITGAQIPLEETGSDGRNNLINAFRTAVADIAEVVVVFGTQIIRGTRAKKTSVFDLQAFTSANAVPLGNIGLSLKFNREVQKRSKRKGLFLPHLDPNVARVPVYPGMKPEIIAYLMKHHHGIVVEGYGSGNIPTEENSLIPVIRQATAKGVPIVICTQCLVGSTEMELYQVGRAALLAGAIPAMDMTPETTLVKLMWVLGQTSDVRMIDSLMQKSFAGELHSIL